ncbi:MAG: rhodanese-like domain-containing protein [Abditibacteriaceae bacterium]
MTQIDDAATISCEEARAKMQNGAILLDVREYSEWLQSHVPDAKLIPLDNIKNDPQCAALGEEVLLLCGSGKRATEAAKCLAAAGVTNPIVITGGMTAWKAAGLPTQKTEGGPISLERQVRIGAGALVLLGLLVPKLRVISYLVPCGLIFAGVSDWCGMAKVLMKMPWNRPRDEAPLSCCNNQTQDESA